MNNLFAAKYLQHLNKKKAENNEKGFTLIELLVVVIIIGVLAAVALPNLLGQVGKARESEAKTAIGALARAQQGQHLETANFFGGGSSNYNAVLGVQPGGEFYTYGDPTATGGGRRTDATVAFDASPIDADSDGVRPFAAHVDYNDTNAAYNITLCIGETKTSTVTATLGSCSGGLQIQ